MEPFFILSKKKVLEQYNRLIDLADAVSFSAKCNPLVAKILLDESRASVTCSFYELSNLNPQPERTTIYLQSQSREEIRHLLDKGYSSFVVDNQTDLNSLLKSATNKEITLFLRMRLKEHSIHTEKHFVFGFKTNQILSLIPELKRSKQIAKIGIHVHRKTQNMSEWSHFDEIKESLGESLNEIDLINIGGGIPCRYKNFNFSDETLNNIFKKILSMRKSFNLLGIKMILEPGRYIAAPSVKLKTAITNIYNQNIILNASVYNSMPDIIILNLKPLIEEEFSEENPQWRYTIKGCTPCSLDIFRYSAYLKNPKINDQITFLNAGAYNFYTEFCYLPKLKTKIVESFERFEK